MQARHIERLVKTTEDTIELISWNEMTQIDKNLPNRTLKDSPFVFRLSQC